VHFAAYFKERKRNLTLSLTEFDHLSHQYQTGPSCLRGMREICTKKRRSSITLWLCALGGSCPVVDRSVHHEGAHSSATDFSAAAGNALCRRQKKMRLHFHTRNPEFLIDKQKLPDPCTLSRLYLVLCVLVRGRRVCWSRVLFETTQQVVSSEMRLASSRIMFVVMFLIGSRNVVHYYSDQLGAN
jgi:hypothetical protein